MTGLTEIIGPASETYAGFAWDYLRRNIKYARDFEEITSTNTLENSAASRQFRYEMDMDKLAHRWGLECFESPKSTGLDALVIWRQDAFPGALSVHYHDNFGQNDDEGSFKLSNFDCSKQHYAKADGTRISVIKSADFWLQISGKPDDIEGEDQSFSVLIDGGKGARRRIDALRQLTSLSRNGSANFKLLGRQKAFTKMRNALIAYDIRANGGSYKDVALDLFGIENVQQDWDSSGGFLKARAIRAFKFGERMVAQDYQSLLPKKAI